MARTLPRMIGFWSAAAILVGRTIGAGIFRSPASIANALPATLPVLGVWAAGGVFALCGALTLAEIAGALPETGGLYVFIRQGWGRLPAFTYGWAELVVIRATALAAVATAFAEYFLNAWGVGASTALHARWVHAVGAVTIAIIGWVNYRGVRWGTLLQNSMTLFKCGGLLALVAVAFVLGGRAVGAPVVSHAAAGAVGIVPVGVALIAVMWVYNGWADVSLVAGEVRDPARNLPRVLILGTLLVIAIYLLANVAYFRVLPVEVVRHSPLVAADVAGRLIGPGGVVAIGIVVMCATLGTLNASMLTGSRVLWAMAHDRLLFGKLARVHPKYETPGLAIVATTALGMLFVSLRSFDQLAATVVTASLPFDALAVAAVFRLRRQAGYQPSFRTIGYPVTPVLFIAATVYLLLAAFVDPASRVATAVVCLVILAGIPIYWIVEGSGWPREPNAEVRTESA